MLKYLFLLCLTVIAAGGAPFVQGLTNHVSQGELLLGELNCFSCHSAEQKRINSRGAPQLKDGIHVTPHWLQSFLENSEGSTMPDMLHGLAGDERKKAAEDLVHYLVSIRTNAPASGYPVDEFKLAQGKALYHSMGCVACHAPQEKAGDMENISVPLTKLAHKYSVGELTRFLLDPVKYRPGGRMPAFGLSQGEASSIAMYLLRQQLEGPGASEKLKGLRAEYFESNFGGSPNFDRLQPKSVSSVEAIRVQGQKREGNFGFRYSGQLKITAAGNYTFRLSSDDGSRLFIGDKMVVDNWGEHAPETKTGSIELQPGEHPIMLLFYNAGGGHELRLTWEGPNTRRGEIPAELLSHIGQSMTPLGAQSFTVDGERATRGKKLYGDLGCASCHDNQRSPAPAFADLRAGEGCLKEIVPTRGADYKLSGEQRQALNSSLKVPLEKELAESEKITHAMTRLNCYACHSRDSVGGVSQVRNDYFKVNGEADLGDEGRIPPHLTRVGDKLRPDWLKQVLAGKGASRPYMSTRMPSFGEKNVGALAQAFIKEDSGKNNKAEPSESAAMGKFGRRLVGTGGLSCISCHTFGQYKSLGIPAMDLTKMHERLQYDWFVRYMQDPQSLRPGTRMPSFWPEGVAVNTNVLGGNTLQQIEAIWQYLALREKADLPPGLVQGKIELVATDVPVIYRNFIEGAGTRAIGVGYPEKANLAFDANDMRIAMIWQGSFIDASKHRSGRGAGFEKPLGVNVITFPKGPTIAALEAADAEWPAAQPRKSGYRFRGYKFDDKQRPAFLYEYKSVMVEDYPIAVETELDPMILRTVTFSGKAEGSIYFRAATGDSITSTAKNAFMVDKKVKHKLHLPDTVKPLVRSRNGKQELLVPIDLSDGSAKLVQEIIW